MRNNRLPVGMVRGKERVMSEVNGVASNPSEQVLRGLTQVLLGELELLRTDLEAALQGGRAERDRAWRRIVGMGSFGKLYRNAYMQCVPRLANASKD